MFINCICGELYFYVVKIIGLRLSHEKYTVSDVAFMFTFFFFCYFIKISFRLCTHEPSLCMCTRHMFFVFMSHSPEYEFIYFSSKL